MSVTPEQKMKLMLELGMEDAADKFAEAHSLTTMRFRPISPEKIEELLAVEYQEMGISHPEAIFAMGVAAACLGSMLAFPLGVQTHTLYGWLLEAAFVATGITIGYFMSKPKMQTHTADVCQMPLKEWEDNLPYGALLSVKEAKAQGYKDFTIFFPAKDDSRYSEAKRIKADPIIVAHRKGHGKKIYNIFAWDDGKVYE